MPYLYYLLSSALLLIQVSLLAQQNQRCEMDDRMEAIFSQNPDYQQAVENDPQLIYQENNGISENVLFTIPVHVIIVHLPGQAVGVGANLSMDRILSQIAVLNEDFRRFNADAVNTPNDFDAADAQIEFCLAVIDPSGNPTDGVTRYPTNQNLNNNEGAIKSATTWDHLRYLNIWVGQNTGALGYAYLPSTTNLPPSNLDGVVVETDAFGGPGYATFDPYDLGRTATHEVGHYLGLRHVWGNNQNCGSDDGFADTPTQEEPNWGCPNHPSPSCGNSGDMFMNYMDYVDDNCMNAFTEDQSSYMQLIMSTSRSILAGSAATVCGSTAPLTASVISQTEVSCFGGFDGGFTIEVIGGVPGYTFLINGTNPQQNGTFTGLPAGNYTITIIDTNGFTTDVDVFIIEPPVLIAYVETQTAVSCAGANDGTVFLGAAGGTPYFGDPYMYSLNNSPFEPIGVYTGLAPGQYTAQVMDFNGCIEQIDVLIEAPDPIVLNVEFTTDATCFGDADGSVQLSAQGGTPGFLYSIDGENYFDFSEFGGLEAGSYTATVIDANNCAQTTTFTINQAEILELSVLSQEDALCFGDSSGLVTLDINGGTGPFLYAIDGEAQQSSPSFDQLTAATYTFVVEDANGCTDMLEVDIESQDSIGIELSAITAVPCFGDSTGSFTATASGGTPSYLYSLDDATLDTLNSFSNLVAGTYQLNISDLAGCMATFEVEIPGFDSLYVAIDSSQNLSCFEAADGFLDLQGIGGAGDYSYSLNGSDFAQDTIFESLEAGMYTVVIEDAQGCTATELIELSEPEAIQVEAVSQSEISCFGADDGTVQLSATGGTGVLSYSLNGETNTNGLFEGLPSGNYSAIATDENGCSNTDMLSIILTAPEAMEVTLEAASNALCAGEASGSAQFAVMGGSGNYIFTINDMANADGVFESLAAGAYTLVVQDANACESSFDFEIEEPLVLSLTLLAQTQPDCLGATDGSLTVMAEGGTGAYTYSLNGMSNASGIFNNLIAGQYNVQVTDANDCSTTLPVNLNDPEAVSAAVDQVQDVSCAGGSDGAVSLSANGGSGNYTFVLDGAMNDSGLFENLVAGNYSFTVLDVNGCATIVEATVGSPDPVNAEIIDLQAIDCAGGNNGSVNISGEGGTGELTFTLNGQNNTSGNFEGLAEGAYQIDITDELGCASSILFEIEAPAPVEMQVQSVEGASCFGEESGSIMVAGSGGTGTISYELLGETNTTGQFENLPAGDYTIVATDENACSTSIELSVDQPAELTLTSQVSTMIACNGNNDGSIQLTATGGTTPYNFQLGDGQNGNGAFENLSAGDYTASVTDGNGCTTSVQFTIEEPAAILSSIVQLENVSCAGTSTGSVLIEATGGMGALEFSLDNQVGSTGSFSNLPAGAYSATITDESGCIETIDFEVEEPEAVTISTIETASNNCAGDAQASIDVMAAGGTGSYTYFLNGNESDTGTFEMLNAGTYAIIVVDQNGCEALSEVLITEPAPLELDYSIESGVGCAGDATASVQLVATGGSGTYSFSSDNQSDSDGLFENLPAGTYQFEVADENGCEAILEVLLEEPQPISLALEVQTPVICPGDASGSIQLLAAGGVGSYTYQIADQTNTNGLFENLTAGTYQAIATDANGCEIELMVEVAEPEPLAVSIVAIEMPACAGELNGSLQLEATGGNGGYTFLLDNLNNADGLFANLAAGTYQATALDTEGCESVVLAIEIDEPAPLIGIAELVVPISCAGAADASIQLSAEGGTGMLSLQFEGQTQANDMVENLGEGTYSYQAVDENGCVFMSTITIEAPAPVTVALVESDGISCFGENDGSLVVQASGGTGSFTYHLNDESSTTGSFDNLGAGSYSILVADENGCMTTIDATVADAALLELTPEVLNNVYCAGGFSGSVQLTGSGGTGLLQYFLNDLPGMDGLFEDLPAGTHTAMVVDENGCSAEEMLLITEPTSVIGDAEILSENLCNGDATASVQLSAEGGVGPYTFMLDDVENADGLFENLSAGIYAVLVLDANECPTFVEFTITQPSPIIPSAQVIQEDNGTGIGSFMVEAMGGTPPYQYSLEEGPFSDQNVFEGLAAGFYTVLIQDANGCVVEQVVEVRLVNRVFEANEVLQAAAVWPNPFRGQLTVGLQLKEASSVVLELFSIHGQQLLQMSTDVLAGEQQLLWPETADLPNGTYLLRIQANEEQGYLRLIKQ